MELFVATIIIRPTFVTSTQTHIFIIISICILFRLPDNVSMADAAMLEPLAVAVHACRRGNVTIGHNVLVLGAGEIIHNLLFYLLKLIGPIGLLNLLTAKAIGAHVCITDIDAQRLEMAKRIGADYTILVEKHHTPQSLTDAIHQFMTPNVSIECSGAEQPTQTAIMVLFVIYQNNEYSKNVFLKATGNGGCCVLVGMGSPQLNLPMINNVLIREVDIRGCFRYANWSVYIYILSYLLSFV